MPCYSLNRRLILTLAFPGNAATMVCLANHNRNTQETTHTAFHETGVNQISGSTQLFMVSTEGFQQECTAPRIGARWGGTRRRQAAEAMAGPAGMADAIAAKAGKRKPVIGGSAA